MLNSLKTFDFSGFFFIIIMIYLGKIVYNFKIIVKIHDLILNQI